jgi:hypothetical protein
MPGGNPTVFVHGSLLLCGYTEEVFHLSLQTSRDFLSVILRKFGSVVNCGVIIHFLGQIVTLTMKISSMTRSTTRGRRSMGLSSSSLMFLLLALLGIMTMMPQQVLANEEEHVEEEHFDEEHGDEFEEEQDAPGIEAGTEWQETYWYMAPSKAHGTGWGVFAAKDFTKGDIIDVTPLFVNLEDHGEAPLVTETILSHYHSQRWVGEDFHSVLLFGNAAFINAADEALQQNVKLIQLGEVEDGYAFGHFALRDITAGEELLSSPDETTIAGWFKEQRQLVADDEDDEDHSYFYSKIYAGYGIEHIPALHNAVLEDEDREYDMQSYIDHRVAPDESGYRNAMAKVDIAEEGTILEIVPALYVEKEMIRNTVLEPLVFFWSDLDDSSITLIPEDPKDRPWDNQAFENELWVSSLPETVQVLVYKNDEDAALEGSTSSEPRLLEVNRYEDTVLLPLGGTLALLERTTSYDPEDYNCVLEAIAPDRWNSQAVTIRIVSTKPIEAGERLILFMKGESSSEQSRLDLYEELVATGQPLTPTPEGMETEEEEEEEEEYDEGEEF